MGQTITLSVRTEKVLKERVGEILHELGLNHSTAINMYYRLIAAQRGIPFEARLPNPTTLQAMEDLEKGRNVKKFETAEELFDDLGI
jgi:DNA-damage-inducible protein J